MKKILSWLFGQTSFIIIMLALQLYIILSSAFRIASDEALAARRAKWVCPEPKIKTGYLARYAKMVSSADRGAILE